MEAIVAAALSLIALTAAGLGWGIGFRSIGAYLLFWLLSACVVLTAWRVTRRVFPDDTLAGAILRAGTLALAIVVAGEMLLGSLGLLWLVPQVVFFAGIYVASRRLVPPAAPALRIARGAPLLLAGVLAPMVIFVVATGITQSPLTLYDSLSYHLVFPARWLLEHRLSIVPTPFSDEAQAYAPANGELYFLWLMLPFHGDVLARIGQLPFYLLGGVGLYSLARTAGAAPAHAVYPPLFFSFARPIVEQAVGADVDLICCALFLASLVFGVVAADRDQRRDWWLWGAAVGLFCGSKYVALVYLPVVLAFALHRGVSRRAAWALPGILLFAAPWYVRNWLIGGSPIYPASLTVAGVTVAHGAYSRAAMEHSVFHTADVRLFPVVLAHAMGVDLALLWIPAALVGGLAMLASRRRFAGLLAAAPAAMSLLFWFGVPDNVDSRLLVPAAIVALLPFAFVFRANRAWNACVHVALAAGVVWLVVGSSGALPFALPWYMADWLSLRGIVAYGYGRWFVAMELVALGLVWYLARTRRRAALALAGVCAACVVCAAGADRWCAPDRCRFLTPSSISLRSDVVLAWRWVSDHTTHAAIAYAGTNVPYPLFGDHLSNRVYYVNIDRHRDWRFDDYDRAHRRRRANEPAPAQPLAVASGVLLPIDQAQVSQIDAVRPRLARANGLKDAWIENLKARGIDLLFVTALSPYEIDYNWHDAGGFPIEAKWAASDPAAFTLQLENTQVRIYAVHAP
ncbi:MAG TPA: glycosyltransferase family 39 protein [Vicinamibacterales bacterium]|nr:glycosyltransferase family 39 protein [Vicinamibacterales bacterium]